MVFLGFSEINVIYLPLAAGFPQNPDLAIQPDAPIPLVSFMDGLQWLVHVGSFGDHPSRQTRIGTEGLLKWLHVGEILITARQRGPPLAMQSVNGVCLGQCWAVAVLLDHI